VVAGRTTEGRQVTVTTTNASAAVTAATGTFSTPEDLGRTVTGTGVPAGATLAAVASGTAATLSVAATATGSRTVTLGPAAGESHGFRGWSPESDTEADSYTVAAVNAGVVPPDRIPNNITGRTHRSRG
jgi:hypothetical protein